MSSTSGRVVILFNNHVLLLGRYECEGKGPIEKMYKAVCKSASRGPEFESKGGPRVTTVSLRTHWRDGITVAFTVIRVSLSTRCQLILEVLSTLATNNGTTLTRIRQRGSTSRHEILFKSISILNSADGVALNKPFVSLMFSGRKELLKGGTPQCFSNATNVMVSKKIYRQIINALWIPRQLF